MKKGKKRRKAGARYAGRRGRRPLRFEETGGGYADRRGGYAGRRGRRPLRFGETGGGIRGSSRRVRGTSRTPSPTTRGWFVGHFHLLSPSCFRASGRGRRPRRPALRLLIFVLVKGFDWVLVDIFHSNLIILSIPNNMIVICSLKYSLTYFFSAKALKGGNNMRDCLICRYG